MSKSTVKVKALNVGTLNAQGCRDEFKQSIILEDALNYDFQVTGLTETHVIDEGTKIFTVKKSNTNWTYELFFSGIKDHNTYTGTGIGIQSDFRPRFKRITDKISTTSFQLKDKHEAHIIVAYAPTHAQSQKEPQIREDFYSELEKVTSKHAKKNTYFSSSVTSMRKQVLDTSYTLITLANMAKVTSTQMVKISWNILKKTILYLPTHFSITNSVVEPPEPL